MLVEKAEKSRGDVCTSCAHLEGAASCEQRRGQGELPENVGCCTRGLSNAMQAKKTALSEREEQTSALTFLIIRATKSIEKGPPKARSVHLIFSACSPLMLFSNDELVLWWCYIQARDVKNNAWQVQFAGENR